MVESSEQFVIDYLITSQQGEIVKQNGRELKKVKIGDRTYNFDRGKPLTDRLKTKLNKVKRTIEYKKHELKEKRGKTWVDLDKNKALIGIQKRYKATITDEQSAFKNYASSYAINDIKVRGIKALQYLKYQDYRMKEYLKKHKGMKVILQSFGTFKSKKTDEELRHMIKSRRYEITNEDEIPNVHRVSDGTEHRVSDGQDGQEFQMDKMELSESGLVIKQIDKLKFNMDKYNPTRGGKFIALPKWVSDKKACINIQNEDNKCFLFAVQCGVYNISSKDHPQRMYHYKKVVDDLNWNGVNFPTSNIDIDTFEENNKEKVSVNVYYVNPEEGKQSILLYRKSKAQKATHQISLLKLQDGDDYHFVCIKDYNRLMGSQTSKDKSKKYHCFHCQHGFQSEQLLNQHNEKGCMAVEGQQIEMPSEDGFMVFKNHSKKLKAPFVIYADFECLTTRIGTVSTKQLNTDKYQHHRPCGFMITLSTALTVLMNRSFTEVRIVWMCL